MPDPFRLLPRLLLLTLAAALGAAAPVFALVDEGAVAAGGGTSLYLVHLDAPAALARPELVPEQNGFERDAPAMRAVLAELDAQHAAALNRIAGALGG
ncbi:MAG: hypothetical protein AAFX50_16130, partial [Acidobacteriota bacterium]